jgi:hypothetical protein
MIIGYYDGKSKKEIPFDVQGLIRPIPSDVSRFVEVLNRHLEKLKARQPVLEDYNNQPKMSGRD